MKKSILIVLSVFLALPAFSQVNFGLKAGVSTTNVKMEDVKTLTSGETEYLVNAIKGANYGFHAGAFVRFSVFGFYIQPELLFASRTDEYKIEGGVATEVVKQQFNQLDLPIMFGAKLGPVRLNAGPAARLLINSPKDLIDHPDFKAMYNDLTFGYQAGIGVDIVKKITLDLRYEGSLQKYQTKIENEAGTRFTLDDRPNAFLFSVGIMF
ncbi:MAG: porin family protein [Bacteroidales bacterium]|jgi:opacity protein-like surface antigen|nr:porin family protein [Bacteroidales bacterium]